MADNAQWINVDNFQTRVMNCFVNLTKANSALYPALTTTKYEYNIKCVVVISGNIYREIYYKGLLLCMKKFESCKK